MQNYLDRKGSDEEIKKSLKKKNINDMVLSKEDKYLAVPQNLLFVYQGLLDKKIIKKISYIDYLNYLDVIVKNEEDLDHEEEEDKKVEEEKKEEKEKNKEETDKENEGAQEEKEEEEDKKEKEKDKNNEEEDGKIKSEEDPLIIIANKEKLYIKNKAFKGEKPFEELCLDKSNLVGNLATLAIAYPELNDKTKEELEEMFKNFEDFDKKLFILLIKLFNNSEYTGDKEEIVICEKFKEFLKNEYFKDAIEDTYKKEDLLKDTKQEEDKKFIEECSNIKKELKLFSIANLEGCKNNDDIIKNYFNEWYDNYEKFMKDLDEAFYIKIGKENEHKIKLKFNELIDKLKAKKSKISNYFVKGLLDDMIDHLNNITTYTEESYAIAEVDVNNALKDSDSYIDSSSKTTYIHFPIVEFDEEYKLKTDFQIIYTLLMDYSDCNNLLKDFKNNEEKRTCMNLGKLKKYLKIQEESTFEGMKTQYNILYDKIMGHSDKILDYIESFEICLLSNLLMNIYKKDKKYLNINTIVEKLNNYCKRNTIGKETIEIDLEWASFLSKTREPFDEIILPEFTPESIIKLFTLKNEKNEDDEGIFSISLMNTKKEEFYKNVNNLFTEEEFIRNTKVTIRAIFEIAMMTIYTDKENIKNVDNIQTIYKEKYADKKEKVDILEVIKQIKENIQSDSAHKELLSFIFDLSQCLSSTYLEDIIKECDDELAGDITKTMTIPDKTIPDISLTKISFHEESTVGSIKDKIMDDIFFILDPEWKTSDMKPEYKKYPSLIYFLFKNPKCEEELRQFLSKTDSIKERDINKNKFPTFLLILRIFSDINCYDLQLNADTYLGSLIKDEILLGLKSKSYDIFMKSHDINWLGLLINNSEFNKWISPKMNYIYNYLQNLCDYTFKPNEESKSNYKNIIHKMIESLFNIIFEGKLDDLFAEEIPKIEEEEESSKSKDKTINNILYLTKLPELIQIILQEENLQFEKKFFEKYKEEIKNINEVYNKNSNLYNDFIKAIEADTDEEKTRRIELNYNKKKNELEEECKTRKSMCSGYLETIDIINGDELTLKDYNKEIQKILKAYEYLQDKSKKYFTREVKHTYVKITFKTKCPKCTLKFGDTLEELIGMDIKSNYYINSKKVGRNKITITTKKKNKEENVRFDTQPCELYNINDSFSNQEFEKAQKSIKSLLKEKPKDMEVILTINKKQKINTNKIKTFEGIKTFEKIMGEGGLKKQLKLAIVQISKAKYELDDIKKIIKELKGHFENLKDLEFQTPKFENQIGPPSLTNKYCDIFKNEFKDMIIGKLESLIKIYEKFDSLKKKTKKNVETFNKSFSIDKFEKNRPKIKKLKITKDSDKFTINYPYIALLTDSEIPKLQFGYSSYNLTIGPIITSFYTGTKYTYNIVSFVDKILLCKIKFDEEKIDEDSKALIPYLSIKSKIPASEPIPIYFIVPSLPKSRNHVLKGHIEIKIDESDIEPLLVEFTFNIILLPLEIYFTSKNSSLFWDENRLCLKRNIFKEKESFVFDYLIRNYNEDISFLNQNYSLKSTPKNEVDNKPIIIQDKKNKNIIEIQMPSINKKQELLDGLFKLHFTNNMHIPLELSGKIKKPEFKIFYYNLIYDMIEENAANIFVYKHQWKSGKPFEIEINCRLQIMDKDKHRYRIELPWTRYPDYYIKFFFKGMDENYNVKNGEINEGININIIARFPADYKDPYEYKYFTFIVDDEKINFKIFIKRETKNSYIDKFLNFPYKALIKEEYKIIDKSDKGELNKIKGPVIYYSPFCVKYYKKIQDTITEPGKIKFGIILEGIDLIVFLKSFNYFWVPNCDKFGDKKFDSYEILPLNKEKIKESINRICNIFNSIRSSYRGAIRNFFSLDYDYEGIKNLGKDELNKYNPFFDFIYWLVSDNFTFYQKMESLNKVFKQMGVDYESLKFLINFKKSSENEEKEKKDKNLEHPLDVMEEEGSEEKPTKENKPIEFDKGKEIEANKDKKNEATEKELKGKEDKEKELKEKKNKEKIDFSPIKYYNIIVQLRKILQTKYEILKEYNFNISKFFRHNEKLKYKKYIEKCFPPFNEEKFNNEVRKQMLNKIDEKKVKGELAETWLFNESELIPKPVPKKEIKESDEFISGSKKTEGKGLDLNLDILKIKDLSQANSLDKIIAAINNGFSISQAFMFCVGKLDKDKTNEIFNYLYEIYHMTKESSNSILSKEIKLFKNSFENLCRSLISSDVDLSKFTDIPKLSKKSDNTILNEEKPAPISFSFPKGIVWQGAKKDYYRYDDRKDDDKEMKITMEERAEEDRKKKEEEEAKKDEKTEPTKKEKPKSIDKVEFGGTGGKKEDILGNEESEDEEEDELKKLEKIHFKKTDKIVPVTTEDINKLKSISDENVTMAIVNRMLKKRIESSLKLTDSFPEFKSEIFGDRDNIMQKKLNRKEGEDYIEQPLFSIINDLSKNFYIKFFQQCINFDRKEVCAVIALDLCRTIDKKFKLFHTLVANAMAHCFNSIEIPYSIVVFCDYGVQFIIKDFEEPHQENISQLIFDAIMVPRCATRIADACYFISQKVNCKDRINKKIFIISNGLDTKLKIGEKWAPIFSNEKEKFCFYFVKPDLKNEVEMNEIIAIWNDFKEKTKTELTIISQEKLLNCDPDAFSSFKNVMQSKIYKNIEIKKSKLTQPEFKQIVEFKKEDFLQLLKSINNEIITVKDYFVQNRIHIPSKGKYKLEEIKIKNPFSAIMGRCSDEDYNQNQIDKESKAALEKLFSNQITSDLKLEYIDFIFTPNKPSMYSPSTKGTRLYLMGLINFCITHGQDNKIWLEKNKGFKKDYRVTVIIDSSISCFNSYMRPHSIKTVLAV